MSAVDNDYNVQLLELGRKFLFLIFRITEPEAISLGALLREQGVKKKRGMSWPIDMNRMRVCPPKLTG